MQRRLLEGTAIWEMPIGTSRPATRARLRDVRDAIWRLCCHYAGPVE
jgi:hypothetical protein